MPDTCSADPDRLLRFAVEAARLDNPLAPEAAAISAALDAVRRSCFDYCPPIPDLGGGLFDLLCDIDRLIACFAAMAMRFMAADCGDMWPPWVDPRSVFSCDLLYRDLFGRGGPNGPPPPIVTLILLGRSPNIGNDLDDIGRAVLGLKRWLWRSAKPAVDAASPFLSPLTWALSSPKARTIGERLAETPVGRRILGPLGLLSGSPALKVAGGALTLITVAEDANRLRRDGNPVKAFKRKGAGYIADVAGATFDVSSAVCEVTHDPVSCGTAIASGGVWVGAEGYKHRKVIGQAMELSVDGTDLAVSAAMDRARSFQAWMFEHGPSAAGRVFDELHRHPGLVPLPTWLLPGGREVKERLRGIMAPPLAAADLAERTISSTVHSGRDVFHGLTGMAGDHLRSLGSKLIHGS